jgi:hypothetical protein
MPVTKLARLFIAGSILLAMVWTAAPLADEPRLPANLSGYRFVGALVVNDTENPLHGFHHVYVNETGLEPLAKGGPYPEGSVFLGMVYALAPEGAMIDEGGGAAVTLMEKVSGAEATGGWRFAMFGAGGERMAIDEAKDCFACHTQVKERDYVFSKPLGVGDLGNL